jgi:hypothetical protein
VAGDALAQVNGPEVTAQWRSKTLGQPWRPLAAWLTVSASVPAKAGSLHSAKPCVGQSSSRCGYRAVRDLTRLREPRPAACTRALENRSPECFARRPVVLPAPGVAGSCLLDGWVCARHSWDRTGLSANGARPSSRLSPLTHSCRAKASTSSGYFTAFATSRPSTTRLVRR